MRPPHLLKRNKRSGYPRHAIWFDTETVPERVNDTTEVHRLVFGWAMHRRREGRRKWSAPVWFRFTDARAFWSWVYERTRKGIRLDVYAHNAGYDLTVCRMWDMLPSDGWKIDTSIVDAPPLCVVWKREDRTIRCLDTLNYWRLPLRDIGRFVGTDKGDMPDDWTDEARADEYCRGDVQIIHDALMRWWAFLQDNDLGNAAITSASQAMGAFRHRFMTHEILIDGNDTALGMARLAYHGGRTECFRLGRIDGPIYHYDVNSMYPAVMRDNEYPTKLLGVYARPDAAEVNRWVDRYAIVAECVIRTDRAVYPIRRGGKVIFPVGTFTAYLTTPELRHAMQNGALVSCERVAVYDRACIFRDFVETLYGLRMAFRHEGNTTGDWLAKRLMNSLYGKFGQTGHHYVQSGETDDLSVRVWTDIDADTHEVHRMRQYAGIIEEMGRDGESYDSHPAIAAHVTAYARMVLWDLFERAGPGSLLYTDTDSLFVTAEAVKGLEPVCDPDALGKIKHEATYDWIALRGAKDYQTPQYSKTKGVRASAEWIDPNTVSQEKWIGVRGLLASGDITAPRVERIVKHLRRTYDKGRVGSDGRVFPLVCEPG